ncbi:hypothetical protein EDB92DRAFT_1817732 [Lactarius akahatsu]|uniref:Uncharacterized protein n=1 Tax=Lactarius akahatsu TaxID=416441 RepID=A0AAD4LDZ8_9AGAM|nr:hypothetical protein EDB92DRAFT_1817732 [Lactarius akahatsu]
MGLRLSSAFLQRWLEPPFPEMGQNMPGYQALRDDLGPGNIWYPFQSQCDWDFSSVVEKLELSYHNMKELNHIIDEEMPGRPKFKCEKICIGGESYDFHFREVIPCIRALFGDPRYSGRLVFAPERHYRDAGCTTQVFGEMYTGKWWWSVQQSLELRKPGATVLPLIISSDKTQLTHFRLKSAYPVYLSIGNIPKDIRSKPTQQAQMLMGYIPATQLKQITNQAARRRALGNLFHSCMCKLLNPIESYGVTGIAMATGDGIWYRCHPILATFIGDYPKQLLVTCTYNGKCPKCTVPRGELGTDTRFPLRNFGAAVVRCHDAGLKPTYHPFWERLPYANIFLSITPDILHQLHQGVLKHLVRWLAALRSGEIDARCSRLPPNHNARYFHKGITWLSKLTGKEHKDIARIILGVVVDLSLPGVQSSARLTRAVRALLNFIYLRTTSYRLDQECIPRDKFKDEYKQMTTWLERQEAMHQHAAFIEWCNCGHLALSTPLTYPHPNLMLHPFLTIHPSEKGITFGALFNRYGAVDFQDALADFIVQHNYPELSASVARRHANNTLIPFRKVSIFHRVKFTNRGDTVQKTVDVLHIRPEACNHHGDTIPGRFDTMLVKDGSRFRVAQIRVVFQLPSSRPAPPTDLAYVEWFSPLSTPNKTHGMYQISRSYRNNRHLASIIPLAEILNGAI